FSLSLHDALPISARRRGSEKREDQLQSPRALAREGSGHSRGGPQGGRGGDRVDPAPRRARTARARPRGNGPNPGRGSRAAARVIPPCDSSASKSTGATASESSSATV